MRARHGKFFWKLFLSHAILLVAVLGLCVWMTLGALDRFLEQELTDDLRSRAEFLREMLEDRFRVEESPQLDRLSKSIATSGPDRVRVTLVLPDGAVLADSEADLARMTSHADRPEIQAALRDGLGQSTRLSTTVGRPMRYVAVRVGPADRPRGVVRVAMAERSALERAREARHLLTRIVVIVAAAACVLALVLARLWTRRINRITAAARILSAGDLTARADVAGDDELSLLARSLNRMRDNLARQLQTIDRQRRTLENLLAQLHEGVVVTGPAGRIVLINPAAARLLDVPVIGPSWDVQSGQPVEEVIPQPELQRMLMPPDARSSVDTAALADSPPVEEDRLTLRRSNATVTLLARASDLALPDDDLARGEQPKTPGRVLVLTDITELTRTLQVKTDFVANASHELRTPLSAIRGAVETMLSMDLAAERDQASKLLHIVERHSGRLEAMVNDLLHLSRLESASARFEPSRLALGDLMVELHERFAERMAGRKLSWEPGPEVFEATLWVNRELLRLVLENLVDNAVKFTDEGGRIAISMAYADGLARITVEDNGCGIPPEEHERVFERFYQVQRARSGPNRGTGLGLSIVRHAVNAMGGSIELYSAPGQGTRITITLPHLPGAGAPGS